MPPLCGQTNPSTSAVHETLTAFDIAQMARGHARKKLDQLRSALEGHQMRKSHPILIRHALRHLAFLAEETEALDQDIATLIRGANLIEAYELLQTIPGIKSQAAVTILAESGPDMKQFRRAPNSPHGREWRRETTKV
jgi:transposase